MENRNPATRSATRLTQVFVDEVRPPRDVATVWYSDGETDRDQGALLLRVHRSGSKRYYFRYAVGGDKRRFIPIGPAGGDGGLTLKAAREKRDELRAKRRHGDRDVGATLLRERAERQVAAEAKKLAREKTLEALLSHYTDHLAAQRKPSARDAKNIFKNHLIDALPALAQRPAAEIEPREIAQATRKLVNSGKERTAGKLRSFISAAYTLALHAETDPKAPAALIGFKLIGNPAQATKPVRCEPRERALSEPELCQVIERVRAWPAEMVQRDALILGLLLGGQRPAQLLRATVDDVDLKANTLTLRDPKGKRTKARVHLLPLAGDALEIVKRLHRRAKDLKCEWLFTATGKHQLVLETVSKDVLKICRTLVAEKRIAQPFRLGDLRRTCETMLAAMGISKDLRAQLLSHGLAGVQDRVYDKHHYLPEKARALAVWAARFADIESDKEPATNVVDLASARPAAIQLH